MLDRLWQGLNTSIIMTILDSFDNRNGLNADDQYMVNGKKLKGIKIKPKMEL
jgi:hypothetical protein